MLRVFVALGKQMPKNKLMVEETEEVARLLAKYGCTMVQGGAKIGLMGVVVQEFQKYSDDVVMIVPEVHKSDLVGAKFKEHYIVNGESDRMRITIHTCDMMIVLPGGSGTLAELAYYNETRKSGEHQARVVVVNTKGFYNKLFKFQKHQIKNGFMKQEHCMFDVIDSAKDLEPILQELITQKQTHIQAEQKVVEAESEVKVATKAKRVSAKAKKVDAEVEQKPKTTKNTSPKSATKKPSGKTVDAKKETAKKSSTKKDATKSVAKKSTTTAKKTATKSKKSTTSAKKSVK